MLSGGDSLMLMLKGDSLILDRLVLDEVCWEAGSFGAVGTALAADGS